MVKTMSSSLKVKDISFTYKNKDKSISEVFDHLSFEVKPGEIIGLIGESGSGKTTLLKLISGALDIKEGNIYLNDEDITNIMTRDRDVAYVFQKPVLYPHMTIYQNVCAALSYYGLTRDEIDYKAKEYLKKYKMTKYINYKPRHLSDGQKQLVCLMRSFIREPAILLLDEPFFNLDVKTKDELSESCFNEIKEHKVTTIFVTHTIEDAIRLSNKIMVLEHGKIKDFGEPFEVLKDPKSNLLKEFIKG